MTKVVITGNHLTPAEALAQRLPRNFKVSYLTGTAGPKFKRYDWWGSAKDLIQLPGLVLTQKRQLQLIKAEMVVSFGGFASVPVCLAAKLLGLPILLHEQTFGAGLAAKLAGRLADVVAISWRSSRRYFPRGRTVLTGNPLRREILNVIRSVKPVIFIGGGHQGSRVINQTAARILPRLVEKFTVYHQFGLDQPPAFKHRGYICRRYFKARELASIYSQAQAVISRAGINTVTELAWLNLPAVLVPLPYTQKNEQAVNAAYLQSLGLAVVLPQNQLTESALLAAVDQLSRLPLTGKKFPRERVKTAAEKIAALVVKLSRET